MSKMKTKSGAKNSPARTRDLRGMDTLSESETRRVKRWMPYGGGI
jgi:large subunit ribosomal protein L35